MKKVFKEVSTLDHRCYDEFGLSEDLLMENAAIGLKKVIEKKFKKRSSILIVSGPGNNGADGIVLARMLYKDYDISLLLPYGAKSKMAKLQLQRAKLIGIDTVDRYDINNFDIVVDAIFGSGLSRAIDKRIQDILIELNNFNAFKIACDIPTGINIDGDIDTIAFKADITVTMGAYKEALYSDKAKDFTGKIVVQDLGISREIYEGDTDSFLLEKSDMKLPLREQKSSHKGDFGHLAVVTGKKEGAGMIAAKAAFNFGAGLVTVINNESHHFPLEIMHSSTLPKNMTAVCIGMGLGNQFDKEYLNNFLFSHNKPLLIDADLFYQKDIVNLFQVKNSIVLTPHPKEFASLLKITKIININTQEVQKRRFELAREFTKKFPDVVLVLKGANTIIAQSGKLYINRYGTNALSKGGSGDVLSGMIASLLAQNYSPLDAAITGSLAHSLSARRYKKNSYSFTPLELIEELKCL